MITIADQYYVKAMDAYPYDLEDTLEQVGYALSYDAEHAGANLLMGKVYMEQFQKYGLAEEYFHIAMANEPENSQIGEYLTRLYIETREFKKAEKLLAYVFKLRTADMSRLKFLEARMHECRKEYKLAIAKIKEAMDEALCNDYIEFLEKELERIEGKEFRKGRYFVGEIV